MARLHHILTGMAAHKVADKVLNLHSSTLLHTMASLLQLQGLTGPSSS